MDCDTCNKSFTDGETFEYVRREGENDRAETVSINICDECVKGKMRRTNRVLMASIPFSLIVSIYVLYVIFVLPFVLMRTSLAFNLFFIISSLAAIWATIDWINLYQKLLKSKRGDKEALRAVLDMNEMNTFKLGEFHSFQGGGHEYLYLVPSGAIFAEVLRTPEQVKVQLSC